MNEATYRTASHAKSNVHLRERRYVRNIIFALIAAMLVGILVGFPIGCVAGKHIEAQKAPQSPAYVVVRDELTPKDDETSVSEQDLNEDTSNEVTHE